MLQPMLTKFFKPLSTFFNLMKHTHIPHARDIQQPADYFYLKKFLIFIFIFENRKS